MEYEIKLQSDDVCEHSDGISELKYIDSEDCERKTDCDPIADPNNNEEGQLKRKETNKDRLHPRPAEGLAFVMKMASFK